MRCVSLFFLWCAFLSGQPVTRDARELALTKSSDAGTTTFHLRNEYSAPATAWIVECHGETDPGIEWTSQWHWSDQEIGLEGKPLEPGKETEFRLPPRRAMPMMGGGESAGNCENFRVIAAVFTDGTVSGDFKWINDIALDKNSCQHG